MLRLGAGEIGGSDGDGITPGIGEGKGLKLVATLGDNSMALFPASLPPPRRPAIMTGGSS